MGDTFALRLSLGKVPVVRLRLYISVIAGTSSSAQVFIILFGNPSDPLALLVFKFASSFCTPAIVINVQSIYFGISFSRYFGERFISVFLGENGFKLPV